jgi:hypothetical protein
MATQTQTQKATPATVKAIISLRKLVAENVSAKAFFEEMTRKQDNEALELNSVDAKVIDYKSLLNICKMLHMGEIANFIVGRRNSKSRIHFFYTKSSVANVVLGNTNQLAKIVLRTGETPSSKAEFVPPPQITTAPALLEPAAPAVVAPRLSDISKTAATHVFQDGKGKSVIVISPGVSPEEIAFVIAYLSTRFVIKTGRAAA